MDWQKKITKLFSVAFLLLFIFSCDGDGCVEADEFDNEFVKVDSNPVTDGVYGSYNNDSGGQVADWHQTGLLSNGEPFLIHVTGAWTPWYGNLRSQTSLNQLPQCSFCAKRGDQSLGNCLCYNGQTPQPEISIGGTPLAVDCSTAENQNDPTKCTCTTKNGSADAYGVFHFPLGFYNKDHTVRLPDEQAPPCKYSAGMGLYLGMFGRSGSDVPQRAYHLFSQNVICPITRNSNGQCIDSQGNDRTRYVFRSANNRIFMKDDHSNNDGTDTNPGDDTYHKANEYIKLIVHDQYYSDNFGQYNVIFLKGIARDGDTGLLEYLVKIVEDALLGRVDDNGKRQGSVIEYMYKAIVQDSYFAATVQISLSIYIALFGFATLFGLAEISSKKEIMSRMTKIALIIFFTNPNSWYFYNQFIVGFFKDSMDFLITFLTNLSDSNLDDDTSPIKIAQQARATTDSSASRFSYIDSIIKMLFSENITKKIWGLFFSSFFGFIYIIAIYVLIGYFLYVMLLAATIYVITLIKLVFIMALGPLFISFSLFPQTAGMFKKWVSFLGARALEVVLLFLILYPFVMIIDQRIIALLSFRTCFEHYGIGHFQFSILKSYDTHDFGDWIHDLITIGGLLFILQMILDQVPKLAGALISIQGQGGGDDGKGTASLAGSIMNFATGAAYSGAKTALSTGGGLAFRGARSAARASGISKAIDYVGDKIPFRGIRARLRDSVIDDALKQARAKVTKGNPSLKGAELEREIRNTALTDPKFGLNGYIRGKRADPKDIAGGRTKSALYGLTHEAIAKRMDSQLVKKPLKDYLKKRAQELKGANAADQLLGKDAQAQLKADARKWAEDNILGGSKSIDGYLGNMKSFMDDKLRLSSSEAAKKFAGNEDEKHRYLNYLFQAKQERKAENAKKMFSGLRSNFKGTTDFVRKVGFEEKRGKGFVDKVLKFDTSKGWDPRLRIGFLDRRRDIYKDQKSAAFAAANRDYITSGKASLQKETIREYYKAKISDLEDGPYKRKLGAKMDARLAEVDKNFDSMKKQLQDHVRAEQEKELAKATKEEREALFKQREAEYKDMVARNMEIGRQLANEPNYKEMIQMMGGAEVVRSGMVDLNGNSEAEAEARMKAFNIGANKVGNLPDTPSGLDDMLGTQKQGKTPDNTSLKSSFTIEKGAAEISRKMSNQKKQYAEYELQQEEARGDAKDTKKIKELKAEIEEAKNDIDRQNIKLATLDQRLSEIDNA